MSSKPLTFCCTSISKCICGLKSKLEHSRCAEGQEVWLFTKSVHMCEDKVDIYWCFLTLKISRTYLHFLFAYNLFSSILSHLRDLKFFLLFHCTIKYIPVQTIVDANSPLTTVLALEDRSQGRRHGVAMAMKAWRLDPPLANPHSQWWWRGGYIHTKKNWSYVQFVLSFQQKVFAELFFVFHVSIFWTHFSIILKAWVRLKLFSSSEFYCSFSVTWLLNTWH